MAKTLNELRDETVAYARKHGFHDGTPEGVNFGERLMLVVAELSEALEADRAGKWCARLVEINDPKMKNVNPFAYPSKKEWKQTYEQFTKGTVEEEIADALLRLFDIAGIYGIDLDWHVAAKKAYNETRPYKHGKIYG